VNTSTGQSEEMAVPKKQPRIGEPVWVQCDGGRCLATLGADGKWKTFYNGKPLHGVIKWLADSDSK
jgi:hypothetical protein